jgi:hypothetical protein
MKFNFFKPKPQPQPTIPGPVVEDLLRQLIHYNVVVLMDNSLSMEGERWTQVRNPFLSTTTRANGLCPRQGKL